MRLLVGIAIALVFVTVFRLPLKKAPWIFYLVAIMFVVIYVYGVEVGLPAWMWKSFMFLFQKNILAFALFCIVMFVGVLNESSKMKKYLLPIRAELSILAGILSIGHVLVFGRMYLMQLVGPSEAWSLTYLVATGVALVAVVLMIPPFITSFRRIRTLMQPRTWKRIQTMAYPFFLLVFVHILLFIGPSALARGGSQLVNVLCYILLLVAYVVLRLRRYYLERYQKQAERRTKIEEKNCSSFPSSATINKSQ